MKVRDGEEWEGIAKRKKNKELRKNAMKAWGRKEGERNIGKAA